jgi:hypothetical protein
VRTYENTRMHGGSPLLVAAALAAATGCRSPDIAGRDRCLGPADCLDGYYCAQGRCLAGAPPVVECLGPCNAKITTASCTGSSYGCETRQETVPVPSGQICIAGASAFVPVGEDAHCSSGNDCSDGKCQASRWWTSCNGTGACRDASDRTDAKVETVVGDNGNTLTAACGTGAPCAIGGVCNSGQCTCPGATTLCSGACVPKASGGNCYLWNSDTVKDYSTGLVWQRATSAKPYNWADAGAYCSGLELGGYFSGWKLPSLDQLRSISDSSRSNPAIDIDAFPNTPSSWFWTSTLYAGDSSYAWYVNFDDGTSFIYATSPTHWVRCVW